MNKFRPEKRSYFQTGVSGYIGSGNNPMVYSKRAMPSFARLRQIYGDHLELYHAPKITLNKQQELPIEIKNEIKRKFKKEHQRNIIKQLIALFISIALLAITVAAIMKVIFYIKERFGD